MAFETVVKKDLMMVSKTDTKRGTTMATILDVTMATLRVTKMDLWLIRIPSAEIICATRITSAERFAIMTATFVLATFN